MDQRESVRARHAAELEAKRKKLEEIRRRKANIRDGDVAAAAPESVARAIDEQENKFDDFIQNILKSSTTAVAASESDASAAQDPSSSAGATAGSGASATLSLAEKLAALSTVTSVAEVHIQPTLVETYNKHTETDITLEHELIVREYEAMTDVESAPRSPKKQAPDSVTSPSKQRALTLESESGDVAMGLSEDEKKQIMQSDAMEAFLLKASRVIERAMTSAVKYDIMVDYGATVEEDLVTEEATETLKQLFTFRDDQWTRCRAVTDVDMSPFYPELMLVAYTARDFLDEEDKGHVSTGVKQWDTVGATNASAFSDLSRTTEGVVMLWSTALPTRPEYRFTCHSQVTSACFNPFDRNIIFGGTYSGQIVVWDTRAKSAPVQKTSLSSGSHTHPIYSLAVVGTKSAYHLVSASTDGRVCVWDVDQLQQPLEMLDLRISMSIVSNYAAANISTDKKMEASVTTFAVHRKENRQLYIGTEAGKLYSTPLDAQKSKTTSSVTAATTDASSSLSLGGVDPLAIDKSILPRSAGVAANIAAREVVVTAFSKENTHFGPVTSMHLNPLLPVHRDGLLLTSSLDSTVKLWSTEHPHSPVFSFEPSTEYVCDVRWSPTHPALFAVVDGAGAISFWNIIKDIEVPALEAKIADKALNKVRWTSDGKNVIVGDASGSTIVYEVPAEVAQPQADDLSLLESRVASAVLAGGLGKS